MSAFTGPLVIEEIVPGRSWRLAQPLRYEAGAEGSGRMIEVPAGFKTDGASIPAFLRLLLAVWGTYGRAAAMHDYLYSMLRAGGYAATRHPAFKESAARCLATGQEMIAFARRWSDREFYLAMRACGTAWWLASLMWLAVRLFGGRYCR